MTRGVAPRRHGYRKELFTPRLVSRRQRLIPRRAVEQQRRRHRGRCCHPLGSQLRKDSRAMRLLYNCWTLGSLLAEAFGVERWTLMFQSMIFTNARLIFPDGIRDGLELVVRDGRIAEIRQQTARTKNEIVDLGGNYLAPGFVDLHIHGALGRDTMEASAEAFRAICDYHASGGTTSLLLTTATAPIGAIGKVINAVRDCRSSIKRIAGVHVEGPFISRAKRGAQREEFIQEPTPEATKQLLEHVDVIKRITIAPEVPGALEVIEKFRALGVSVSGGHSDAWDDEARAAFAHGMRSVTHTFNCMSRARRRGIGRIGGLLEFALSEPQINCELIADGHHVSATLMKMLYRAKGAAGICLVTDASAGAGLPNESSFKLGDVACVVKDGACWVK